MLHAGARAESVAAGGTTTQLADLGIHDAEQLVAIAGIDENHDGLAGSLGITKEEVDGMVKEARSVLPPGLAAQMEQPLPPLYGLGALEPPPEMRAQVATPESIGLLATVSLPLSVNLISFMSPVRFQGARGTCVSFALTAIHEYARRAQGTPEDFSEQYLYHQMKLIDGSVACGTWQRYGAQVLGTKGQCLEITWPYNPNLPCNKNGVLPPDADSEAAEYPTSLVPVVSTDVAAIKAALADRRPVGISIPVYNSWYLNPETQRSGRITMPLSNDVQAGGHAVCLVGYQDDPSSPGGGYFILRNSWGTNWGYQDPYGQGYGTIAYQYISGYCWETYTLASQVSSAPKPVARREGAERTITIRVKGNVNLIIE